MSRPPPKGACPHGDGVFFRVWAPGKREVDVVIEDPEHRVIHLGKSPDGMFSGFVPGLGAGALYRYRLDGQGPFPDPASRFQPQGIHGPSEVMDQPGYPGPIGAGKGPRARTWSSMSCTSAPTRPREPSRG